MFTKQHSLTNLQHEASQLTSSKETFDVLAFLDSRKVAVFNQSLYAILKPNNTTHQLLVTKFATTNAKTA